jgi:hypothetical protein
MLKLGATWISPYPVPQPVQRFSPLCAASCHLVQPETQMAEDDGPTRSSTARALKELRCLISGYLSAWHATLKGLSP